MLMRSSVCVGPYHSPHISRYPQIPHMKLSLGWKTPALMPRSSCSPRAHVPWSIGAMPRCVAMVNSDYPIGHRRVCSHEAAGLAQSQVLGLWQSLEPGSIAWSREAFGVDLRQQTLHLGVERNNRGKCWCYGTYALRSTTKFRAG